MPAVPSVQLPVSVVVASDRQLTLLVPQGQGQGGGTSPPTTGQIWPRPT